MAMTDDPQSFDERGYLLKNYITIQKLEENPEIERDITDMDIFFINDHGRRAQRRIIDLNWVRGRFNLQTKEMADERFINSRFFSTASYKFSSTKLGSHLACNPKPGFTLYADVPPAWNPVRYPSLIDRNTKSLEIGQTYPNDIEEANQKELLEIIRGSTNGKDGFPMGRYYSEAIDDNQQLVYLQFGVKKFNGLLDFLIGAIDYGDVVVANTGRPPRAYRAGRIIGTAFAFVCFPFTTALVWVLKIATGLFAANTAFDYYYMVPTMHTYWAAVNSLVTQFATELKIINPAFDVDETHQGFKQGEQGDIGVNANFSEHDMEMLSTILGNGILDGKTGYVDIWAIMSRPQSMYRRFIESRKAALESSGMDPNVSTLTDDSGGITGVPGGPTAVQNVQQDTTFSGDHNATIAGDFGRSPNTLSFDQYLNNNIRSKGVNEKDIGGNGYWEAEPDHNVASDGTGDGIPIEEQISTYNDYSDNLKRTATPEGYTYDFTGQLQSDSWLNRFKNSFDSAVHDGGNYAIFAVDFTGSLGDSVNNSTAEIETEGLLKSTAAGANNMKFNLSGGNLGLGVNMAEIGGAVKDFLKGGLDGITLGLGNVLSTIFGDAYVDIPKRWSDSQVDIGSTSYTMKLRTPYGDPYSILQNELIPLAMILAGSLPLSTGKSSYTSPFLCSLTCQGVQNVKLGMITDVSITRGTSNLPFTQGRRPLGIDVTFKVSDFSNLVTAPLNTSIFSKIFHPAIDEQSHMGRYVATVAGRDIQTYKYLSNKIAMRLGAAKANIKALLSPSRLGTNVGFMLNGPLSPFVMQGNFNVGVKPSQTR